MKGLWWISSLLLIILLYASCKPKKHLTLEKPENRTERPITKSELADLLAFFDDDPPAPYSALQIRATGFVTLQDKNSQEVTLQIRIQSGQGIWISATALLGREVGRILLTPDSVYFMNRLESTYFRQTLPQLSRYSGWELSYPELENLFLGKLPLSVALFESKKVSEKGVVLHSQAPEHSIHVQLSPAFSMLTYYMQSRENQVFSAAYEYAEKSNSGFPTKWSVLSRADSTQVQATLEYQEIKYENQVSLPFSIPNSYKNLLPSHKSWEIER